MKAFRFSNVLILVLFIALTALAASQIPKIKIDSSTEVFIPDKHEIKKINKDIETEFGSLDSIMLGIQTEYGSVTDKPMLDLISEITSRIEKDKRASQVMSLTNMDYIRGLDNGIQVVPLYDSTDSEGEKKLNDRLLDWKDIYFGTFLSENRKLAAIIVQPVKNSDETAVKSLYRHIKAIASEYGDGNVTFHVAGLAVVKDELNRSLVKDVYWLIPAAAGLILLMLFISFRRWEAVAFPIICLLLGAVWIGGIIGLFHIPFTMAGMLVPVLLLVVGSAYSIHILSHFYVSLSERKERLSFADLHHLVMKSRRKVFIPILLAGATTAGGFLSLLSSPLEPFRMFGVLSAVGVAATQIGALVLIPVLMELRYAKGAAPRRFAKKSVAADIDMKSLEFEKQAFGGLARWLGKSRFALPLVSALVIIVTLALVPKIRTGTDMLGFFSKKSTITKDAEVFDNMLGGTDMINLAFSAPNKGDVLDPDFLLLIEDFKKYMMEKSDHASSVESIVPGIERINQLLNVNSVPYARPAPEESADFSGFFSDGGFFGSDAESIVDSSAGDGGQPFFSDSSAPVAEAAPPDSRGTGRDRIVEKLRTAYLQSGGSNNFDDILNQLMVEDNFQGMAFHEIPSDPLKYGLATKEDLKDLIAQYLVLYNGNLEMMINDSLEPDRTLLTVRMKDTSGNVLKDATKVIHRYWDAHIPEGWSYELGGGAVLAVILSDLVTTSQYYSLAAALLIVWLIVSIMFRSPLAGMMALVPVLFALAGIFIFMVIGHFKLDIVTSLLASLAIGIGIDYAIHFLSACKRQIARKGRMDLAYILRTTGRAIFVNALSVAVGFSALLISSFVPIRQMGVLFAVSMLFACLASLLVLPWLVLRIKPKFLLRHLPPADEDDGSGSNEENGRKEPVIA